VVIHPSPFPGILYQKNGHFGIFGRAFMPGAQGLAPLQGELRFSIKFMPIPALNVFYTLREGWI
jgi:hypothetical protein